MRGRRGDSSVAFSGLRVLLKAFVLYAAERPSYSGTTRRPVVRVDALRRLLGAEAVAEIGHS